MCRREGVLLAGLSLLVTLVFGVRQGRAADEMVQVPAGEFTMGVTMEQIKTIVRKVGGAEKDQENATPVRKINLPAFSIDKYEVTNGQYKKFMDAAKHPAPEFWEGGALPAGKEKHPVTGVMWNDAVAYCKWAGKRLPTEEEWEKAARGTDGRIFPWGNKWKRKVAHTAERNKFDTMAVGKYPKGASPYGALDMAGNVAEWTASAYKPYPGTTVQNEFFGDNRNVVRGGSWDDAKHYAVTTNRSKYTPVTTFENLGFRCVR